MYTHERRRAKKLIWAKGRVPMKHTFVNDTPITIDRFRPTDVRSTINVSDVTNRLQRVTVTVHVHHTYTRDLRISLIGPGGTQVPLVGREGGSGDHFINTTFDDASTTSITDAFPPFSGTFNPEGRLADFTARDPNGIWTLSHRGRCVSRRRIPQPLVACAHHRRGGRIPVLDRRSLPGWSDSLAAASVRKRCCPVG